MLKKLFSWWCGYKIGETRLYRDNPYVLGSLNHFLPSKMWNSRERQSLRFACLEFQWSGFRWEFIARHELTRNELLEKLKLISQIKDL